MTWKIRSFQISDYEQVATLWQRAGIESSPSDRPEGLLKKLERDPELFIVAEEADRIVGAVIGAYDGRRGWIYHLAVAPDQQRDGLGSAIMNELEHRFRAIGCEKANLLVTPENAQVQKFYEHLGYGCNELIFMEKWLN